MTQNSRFILHVEKREVQVIRLNFSVKVIIIFEVVPKFNLANTSTSAQTTTAQATTTTTAQATTTTTAATTTTVQNSNNFCVQQNDYLIRIKSSNQAPCTSNWSGDELIVLLNVKESSSFDLTISIRLP